MQKVTSNEQKVPSSKQNVTRKEQNLMSNEKRVMSDEQIEKHATNLNTLESRIIGGVGIIGGLTL